MLIAKRGGLWWSAVPRSLVATVVLMIGVTALPSASRAQYENNAGTSIHVWKSRRQLELRNGAVVLATFPVALGTDPRLGKRVRGDNRTPEGRYYITEKKPGSRFHRFLGLSYPNIEDADRGYADRLIDASQWASIFVAIARGVPPPWHTSLGGWVGIHGFGGRPFARVDWTEGCIAVSDDDIDYIYDSVSVGTPVLINE